MSLKEGCGHSCEKQRDEMDCHQVVGPCVDTMSFNPQGEELGCVNMETSICCEAAEEDSRL